MDVLAGVEAERHVDGALVGIADLRGGERIRLVVHVDDIGSLLLEEFLPRHAVGVEDDAAVFPHAAADDRAFEPGTGRLAQFVAELVTPVVRDDEGDLPDGLELDEGVDLMIEGGGE